MYPQVTRASSIASESTIRPRERPFVAGAGPEHPYTMYPQNTVPEEADPELTASSITLGFPGMGHRYQAGIRVGHADVADIVGSDGHIEELPPYSRYPENVVPKVVDTLGTAPTVEQVELSSAASTAEPREGSDDASQEQGEEIRRKEGWREMSKKKVCCGMALWVLLLIVAIVFFSAALGGVVGGVVGNAAGSDAVADAMYGILLAAKWRSADHVCRSTANTATVYLDASPLPTGAPMPSCPVGHFDVPLNSSQIDTNACIVDPYLGRAWDCMSSLEIGIEMNFVLTNGQPCPQVTFDDYSVAAVAERYGLRYGAQLPNLNCTGLDLYLAMDKDDHDLGHALFNETLYNKLVICKQGSLTDHRG